MLLAMLVVVRTAFGQSSARVVAIAPDPGLERALGLALTSWHVDVVSADGPTPGRDMDDAIRTGHRIARSSSARAILWISSDANATYSLWVYDERAHAIAVRPLATPPPYDDETAAAIAMTVKTLLLNALERPPPPPPSADDEEARPPRTNPPSPHHTLRIDVLGGFRIPTNATDTVAARVGADLTYFPSFFKQQLGLAVAFDAGPSVGIAHDPYFHGSFSDTVGSASLRWRIPLRRFLSLELGAGMGLHFSIIDGVEQTAQLSGRITRTDVSFETLMGVEFSWKFLRVAPLLGGSFLLHYEHYRASGVQVFDVPPGQMSSGLRLGVEIP